MPIASSNGSAIAKPITVPNTAWNALAPVIGALVRTTLSVANSTQKPFSTSNTPPSTSASASPAASRRLFWKVTERMLRVEDPTVTRRSSMPSTRRSSPSLIEPARAGNGRRRPRRGHP